MEDDTNWLQTKDVPPNRRHHCSKSQQQCHPRARAMNPQGWFQSVLGFPNQSALKLSQVSQHPQQSKYPSLLYPACTTPREWTSTLLCHAVPQAVPLLLFWGLQHNWSRISMLELSGLAVVRKMGHRPTHLRHAGPRSWLDCTSDHYNQLSHG
jgi:hypothetical protein